MAPRYSVLRATAFEVPREGLGSATHVIDFPDAWRAPLRALASRAQNREWPSVPIRSLNVALQALIPDMAVALRAVGRQDGDQPWIVSSTPLPVERIMPIVDSWVRSQQNESTPPDLVAATIAALRAAPLVSRERSFQEFDGLPGAAPFRIIESQAASLLTAPGASLDVGGAELSFVRCSASDGTGGEIMSWPPIAAKRDQTYSFVARAMAHTVPGETNPLLYLHFGVRRWMPRKPFIAPRKGTSVYLRTSVPYIETTETRRGFTLARAVSFVEDTGDGRDFRFRWDDNTISVLHGAGLDDRLVDLDALMDDPTRYQSNDPAPALVPYRPGRARGKDGVSPGVGAHDRNQLFDWSIDVLEAARPLPLLERSRRNPARRQSEKSGGSLLRGSVVASVAATIGPRVAFELMLADQRSVQLALDALCARFPGVQITPGEPVFVPGADGPVELFVTVPPFLSAVIAPLSAPVDQRDKAAATQRARDIYRLVPRASVATVALVGIESAEVFGVRGKLRGRDPKNAIRHGLARTGRISQFVHPADTESPEPVKKDIMRYEKAIDDALRQLGLRPSGFVADEPAPGVRPQLLAIWMLKRNKSRSFSAKVSLPVAVLMNFDGSDVKVRTARDRTWTPLHQALPDIGCRSGGDTALYAERDAMHFIEQAVRDVTRNGTPTLLLTSAQNLRAAWEHLRNPMIGVDNLAFGAESLPIADFPGLRHIRVRTSQSDETPEGYGYVEGAQGADAVGKPRGLWVFRGERLFVSTAAKAVTDKTAKGISKLPVPGSDRGFIDSLISNPQLLEIYVAALQPGDEPASWAALAHGLRDANPYFAWETVLPWPLRVAEQIGEYISPIVTEPDDESVVGAAIDYGETDDDAVEVLGEEPLASSLDAWGGTVLGAEVGAVVGAGDATLH